MMKLKLQDTILKSSPFLRIRTINAKIIPTFVTCTLFREPVALLFSPRHKFDTAILKKTFRKPVGAVLRTEKTQIEKENN